MRLYKCSTLVKFKVLCGASAGIRHRTKHNLGDGNCHSHIQSSTQLFLRMIMGINKTINRHWRDWAALVYLFICLVDFFIAPLMWNIGMSMESDEIKMNTSRWVPLTLQAGAMFHLSFGAILGATAWRKKDEVDVHNRNGSSS